MANEWKKVEMSPVWNRKDEKDNFILKNGDSIEGIFMGADTNVGPNKSNLYSVKTDKGALSIWGSTVLDIRLKNVEMGEEVKIIYLGLADSEKVKGRQYHNYDVFHRDVDDTVKEEETSVGDPGPTEN